MTRLLQLLGYLPKPINWQARLAADVEKRRNSFECEQYRRRRTAAKLGLSRKAGVA